MSTIALILVLALLHRRQVFIEDESDITLAQYASRKRVSIESYQAYLNLPESTRKKWNRFVQMSADQRRAYYFENKAEIDLAAKATTERFRDAL
jgi:hypothetical protein